ncbi:PAS domain-containing protein [uncultured Methanoregula sp.]|uniref:PAS domain-containing protein n=1 Tax=uncultured Methanoregula sp. TaxID=1005933 RepID=UPI002AAC3253|nr:PAS domain-containing protein [uncultured Methanoregula sp.]
MTPKDIPPKKSWSLSRYILLFMLIPVICIGVLLTANDYVVTKNNFEDEAHYLQFQTEQNIGEALHLTDTAENILDDSVNDRMQKGLVAVNDDYERSGHNPATMNLTGLKAGLGEDFDIYVINEYGVIVATTYMPELGMDFRQIPYFYEYLTKIRNSQGFFPDRVVHELLGAGQYRKFAYMPTADHRYVLELGLAGPSFDSMNAKLDEHKNIHNIVFADPYVEQYRVFNSLGRYVSNGSRPEQEVRGYLDETISTRSTLEVSIPGSSRTIRYLFIELKDEKYGSDPSRIVEITYNTGMMEKSLNNLILFHLLISLSAIILGCSLAFIVSGRLTRPVTSIVTDVEKIAAGDLDHRIGSSEVREFQILEQSINSMVDSLKSAFLKVKDDEIFKQEMIDQLPVAVFMKNVDDGRYVYWNKASEVLFGRPAGEIIGKTDRELFSKGMVAFIEKEDCEARLNRIAMSTRTVSLRGHGDRIIHMIIVPIFSSTKTERFMLGIAEDLTEEAIHLKTNLLFSITRHDILDHLSVIMESLERAQLMTTPEAIQAFFDKTIISVELIRNQISFMRSMQDRGITSPKWQTVQQSFYNAVEQLPDNDVDIQVDLGDLEIFADPFLPRIFLTLLLNSFNYGGKRLSHIRLYAERDRENLALVYEDNGSGIPFSDKVKIFIFEESPKTWQGLFLIRELLTFTGITISETGDPETGVRFVLLIPPGKFRNP